MRPNNGEAIPPPFPSPVKAWHNNTYPSLSPSRPELSAKGKNVLITGGGTGIGAGTAHAFAQAGASRIGLLGRREQPLLDTKASLEAKFPNTKVFVASTDISDKAAVDAAFAAFAGNEKIHVLICNAAVAGPDDAISKVDGTGFLSAINLNLSGALWLAKAFDQYAAAEAVVVDVNSMAAHVDVADKFACYSVAKIGIARLWDSFAFGHPHIRVYHIQPGIVDTDMNRAAGGVEAAGMEDHGELLS
jgi:NAD(P)-dependent dehydrogenase (short-subunit alcohol dehydrogenase family)